MQVLKFDAQAVDALTALGFTVADDKKSAYIADGDHDIEATIYQLADRNEDEFRIEFHLPNGCDLQASLRRPALLAASGIKSR